MHVYRTWQHVGYEGPLAIVVLFLMQVKRLTTDVNLIREAVTGEFHLPLCKEAHVTILVV